MLDALLEFVLLESLWVALAMGTGFLAAAALLIRQRDSGQPRRLVILWAMNLFYGCMVGTLASGHLLAVTVKRLQGTLDGSVLLLYPLGLALAVPAWWLIAGVCCYAQDERRWRRRMLALNAGLFLLLLALGPSNGPLAVPAALNVAYQLHARRVIGWTIVTVSLAANGALFVGALVFAASGQSFEDFSGM